MATYTENYQLHQWVPEDDFLRTDFNTDFQKIDAAIRAVADTAEQVTEKCGLLYGSFQGDGQKTHDIMLGVHPKALIMVNWSTMVAYVTAGTFTLGALCITDMGFRTGVSNRIEQNSASTSYIYVALI